MHVKSLAPPAAPASVRGEQGGGQARVPGAQAATRATCGTRPAQAVPADGRAGHACTRTAHASAPAAANYHSDSELPPELLPLLLHESETDSPSDTSTGCSNASCVGLLS